MARPGTVAIDVEMRLNGKPITGALVVGPDEHLVVNLGQHASRQMVEDARVMLLERWPALAPRVLLLGGESMAVVRKAGDS